MKPLSKGNHKAVNEGATYWVCYGDSFCASLAVSKCPTAAEGGSGCKCCADAKKQQVCAGKRPKNKLFSSTKKQKWEANKK
jgi:hypothetical protein